jgi:hypothetical protein
MATANEIIADERDQHRDPRAPGDVLAEGDTSDQRGSER